VNHLHQFVFTFSSAHFAFWFTNRNEHRKIREIEKIAIEAVYLELQKNIDQLKVASEFHVEIRDNLFAYADSVEKRLIIANDLKPRAHLRKIFTRNANSLALPNLGRNAWETLQRSEAYAFLDYVLTSRLGKLYGIQKQGVEIIANKIVTGIFSSKSLYQKEESEAVILLASWTFRELAGQEQYLLIATQETSSLIEEHYPDLLRIKGVSETSD